MIDMNPTDYYLPAAETLANGGHTFDRKGNKVEHVRGYQVGLGGGALLSGAVNPAIQRSRQIAILGAFIAGFVGGYRGR